MPSLFVWGAADQLVPSERSSQLMDCFSGPKEMFEHPGAHMVRLYCKRVRAAESGVCGAETVCCMP